MIPIKVLAVVDTSGKPVIVYCTLPAYLWAYKVYTNCKAFLNGQTYWICPRDCKVIGRAK